MPRQSPCRAKTPPRRSPPPAWPWLSSLPAWSASWTAAFQRRELLRRVDPRRGMSGREHPDAHPALDRAQLLEPLLALEPARWPGRELEQEVAPEAVHPDVAQHSTRASLPRRVTARKVEGEPLPVHPDLDDLGAREQCRVGLLVRERRHTDRGIGAHPGDQACDRVRIELGLVALQADDHLGLGMSARHLGHAIGAARAPRRRALYNRAEDPR